MTGRKLRQRLEVMWNKATVVGQRENSALQTDRYVPRAYGQGPGWGVWDRKRQAYVSDKKLLSLTLDQLRDEKLAS